MINLLRIDERLIHGQVAYTWTKEYRSDALMVITEHKKNDLERMSLEMACPRNLKCFILTIEEAVNTLEKYKNREFFVVTDSPKVVLELIKHGINIDSVNIGGIYHQEGREKISKTVYLDENLKNIFGEIAKNDVELEIRAAPRDKKIDLRTKI